MKIQKKTVNIQKNHKEKKQHKDQSMIKLMKNLKHKD